MKRLFLTLSIVFLCTTIIFGGLLFISKAEVNELKQAKQQYLLDIQEEEVENKKETETEVQLESREVIKKIVEPVNEFLKITKDGREDVLYIEKLEEAKKYLSDDVYKQLSPKMSKEQIEQLKNEKITSEFTCSIDELRTAIRRTAIGYQVYATYTYTIEKNGKFHTETDYLFIADVVTENDKYVISKIRKESVLQESFERDKIYE